MQETEYLEQSRVIYFFSLQNKINKYNNNRVDTYGKFIFK